MGGCASQEQGSKRPDKGGRKTKVVAKRPRRKDHSEPSSEESEYSESSDSACDDKKKDDIDCEAPPVKIMSRQTDIPNNYPPVSQYDLDILFYKAHTIYHFLPVPVSLELLRNAMKLALLAPTAYNCCPMRVIFCTTPESKEKLMSCVDKGNLKPMMEAPVTAIICTDDKYTHHLPKLMPYVPNAQQMFEQYEDLNEMIKIRNANLQGGYLILALRSLGLGCGPLSGFDQRKVNELFLQNTTWKSNFLINIGYIDVPKNASRTRAYRLPFEVAAKLIQ